MEETEETNIPNAFGAPTLWASVVTSTMDEARILAERGFPHGTVIAADVQERGRGSGNRRWTADGGTNLFFTVLLRYDGFAAVPRALTLRTGLAVSAAVEDMAAACGAALERPVLVKWPNDVMIRYGPAYRKTAGILTEGNGSVFFIGVGVNVGQVDFPEELQEKAGSLALALGPLPEGAPRALLGKILARLHGEIGTGGAESWRARMEERLYQKGGRVRFTVRPALASAAPASEGETVEGILTGIGPDGEILIRCGDTTRAFVSGELEFPSQVRGDFP
jgi:BirA family biotin operon repressor/biotin-[acetyl-CoA-carboxylase] ligase